MQPFQLKNKEKMLAIINVFSALDEIRWASQNNYNLINYCSNDLTADEKLLTHWLCYIMDRQMPFERIWDVGGYVISHLVYSYTRSPKKEVKDLLYSYIRDDGKNIRIETRIVNKNQRLMRNGIKGDRVSFASRYMPEDLVLIFRTLYILDRAAHRSLSRFIATAVEDAVDLRHAMQRIAFSLNQLTYQAGGTVSASEFHRKIDEQEKHISDLRIKQNRTYDQKLFERKRLWCAFRDYLKSPEFNPIFVNALKETGISDASQWVRSNPELKSALDALELPGGFILLWLSV